VGFEVFAEQLISTATVEASATQLGVISDNTLTNLKVFDLGTNGSNYTHGLVAGNQREL
jgi:hypothetical protein